MDVAGTFFANFMTILIALQDKSVAFHFTNFSNLHGLDFFECSNVQGLHLPPQKKTESQAVDNTTGPVKNLYCQI